MATLPAQLVPITTVPGVQPTTDWTALATPHYTFSDKIRFWRGIPQKIGGWRNFPFQGGMTIKGKARSIYSAVINNVATTIIGTNSYLYALFGQVLTNITPLATTATIIADSITNDYAALGADPVATVIGDGTVTITDTNAAAYKIGDNYTLAGAATTNGILNTTLNATHVIHAIGVNTVSFLTAGTASSTGTGGGAGVVRSTGLLTFAVPAHGQVNGDRVGILLATDVGGVLAAEINVEYIIRNVTTNTFDGVSAGTATSFVAAGGGAATTYQKQIAAGFADQSFGVGYGLGYYGVGLYGVSKMSISGITYPRIWYFDRFADRIVMTPGNQGAIYVWDGNTAKAPSLLANAPTAVNFLFVSNNILMTYGYQNINNQLFGSDSGDATIWTASSANQVFQDIIAGSEALISSVPVLGVNLLFTNSQTYVLSYIGLPLIWSIALLDNSNGIIAPMARCSVNGVAYWMGNNNFYMWSGGNIQQIQSNTQNQCTMLKYVFGNINYAQSGKCFTWYNDIFNEIWFHYPSAASNECDRIARLSISDMIWTPDTMDRISAEYPQNLFNNPRLISNAGNLFVHETGTDDDTNPLPFTLTTNMRTSGKETCIISGFVPDSIQTGDINVNITGRLFPQSSDTTFNNNYTIESSGTGQDPRENIQLGARFWQYTWSGNQLGQDWIMGNWNELIQKSAPN